MVHLVYAWNQLMLQRNWVVRKHLTKTLATNPVQLVVDAGCGEGMHLFPMAKKFPATQFLGLDKNRNHLVFCKAYLEKTNLGNAQVVAHDLTLPIPSLAANLLTCVGALQYIREDDSALRAFYGLLQPNGKILIYVPVNGRMILPLYRRFFLSSNHYERSQNRVRVYQKNEILEKMQQAGFTIDKLVFTYGTPGILGHEMYSLLLMGLGSGKWHSGLFGILLALLFPIIILLKAIDYFTKKNNGNGLLIIASKNQ